MSCVGKFTIGLISDDSKYSRERIDLKFSDFGAFENNDPLLDVKFLNKLQKTRRGKTVSKTIQLFE